MNPITTQDGQVDQIIGSAYQIIKYVATNMEAIITLAESLDPSVNSMQTAFEALRRTYAESGFVLLKATFKTGAAIGNRNHVLIDDTTGIAYSWGGALPYFVPQNSTLESAGGIGELAWIAQDLSSLRKELSRPNGVSMVGGAASSTSVDSVAVRVREALRRSYAAMGYNVVGAFQGGFTYVDANDIGIDESTGKGYTGPAGYVAAGTDPTSGGFVDRSDDIVRKYKTVADMLQWAPQLPVGTRVSWDDYFVSGDCGGGRGVIKSGSHTEDGGSIFSLGETKYIEAFLPATVMAIKFGVKFDNTPSSAAHNTTQLQRFVDCVSSNYKEGVWGSGVAYYNGFTLTKSSRLRGIKSVGPEFGVRDNYVGSTLRNASQNNHAIVVDATGNTPHTGIHCIWDDFTVHGNREVAGSVGGHNILLKADTTGEVTFIEGCQFRNIQSIYAKELGWGIQGTVFANDWWACSGSYCGTHGFSRAAPGGNPVTNNLHGCKLFENAQWGVYNDGITMSLFGCNVAQNYSGGLLAKSGYVESVNCDYEQNHNVSIESRDSSGSGILVTGGKIHKSPGNLPGTVGIRAAAGSSGGVVRDVLFVNFIETGDKIFESTGGSLSEFSYRLQNVTTGQLTPTDMQSIERIPNLDFPRRGLVEFAGSGVGRRVATVTLTPPFKVGYTIEGSIRDAFGTNPIGSGISTSNITLASVQLAVDVTAEVGPVYVDWVAIGR